MERNAYGRLTWMLSPQAAREPRYENTPVRAAFERYAGPPEFELYDLEGDPVESVNLAGKPEMRAVQDRLTQALLAWRKQTQDPFLDVAFLERMAREGAPALRRRNPTPKK